jgi:hypothetical protein
VVKKGKKLKKKRLKILADIIVYRARIEAAKKHLASLPDDVTTLTHRQKAAKPGNRWEGLARNP